VGTTHDQARPGDLDEIAKTQRDLDELGEVWAGRHRLDRGSPEYLAALKAEDRLLTRIWRRLRAPSSSSRTPDLD
jgi:hypothetical protein